MAQYLIQSFTDPSIHYRVAAVLARADRSRGGNFTTLTTCSCPVYTSELLKCKHLFLASRITGHPVGPPPRSATSEPVASLLLRPPPHTSVSPEEILREKQTLLDSVAVKLAALPQRAEQLLKMDLTQVSRLELISLETMADQVRREVTSVVTQAPLYAFLM
jgi:hypothetical protein